MKTNIKETSTSILPALCEGNSPVAREFPALRASNMEKKLSFNNIIMLWGESTSYNIITWNDISHIVNIMAADYMAIQGKHHQPWC